MFQMILMLALTPINPQPKTKVAQFQPCVWPRTCSVKKVEPVSVAQFQPCVWPRTCSAKPAAAVSQFLPDVKTCDYPNKCS